MKEVEAYKIFGSTPGIIHSVDYSIATERGGGEESKTVYVLLPYYKRGNLQDMINANLVNHSKFPERKLMGLFLGVCRALRGMHVYQGGGGAGGQEEMVVPGRKLGGKNTVNGGADVDDEQEQGRSLLTEDERVTQARETGGKRRSYAHRDIKPGWCPWICVLSNKHGKLTENNRKHHDLRLGG